jgi:hypothetical protein
MVDYLQSYELKTYREMAKDGMCCKAINIPQVVNTKQFARNKTQIAIDSQCSNASTNIYSGEAIYDY